METPTRAKTREHSEPTNWSILDGKFTASPDFPLEKDIQAIKGLLVFHSNELTRQRIYYTELLIYALKYVNSAVESDPELVSKIRFGLMDQTRDVMSQMGDTSRKQDIKKIAEEQTEEPMGPAKEIPIMQAFKAMQESPLINYEDRIMLDAIARYIYIQQTGAKL